MRRLVGWLGPLAVAFSILAVAGVAKLAVAQDSWVFTTEIPCATAPVYGVQFNRCWVSNTRSFRVGNVRT